MIKRLAIAALIVATPAFALDGTRSPGNVPPVVGVSPGDIQNWHNPNLLRAAKELLEQSRQLRRAGDELLAQANPGATASLRDQLVGAWAIVSCNPNAQAITPTCGTNPNGILINDASGRYTWIIALRGRPKASANRSSVPAEELGTLARGLTAQFGTWSVNEADKTYTTHIDGALFPNVEGTEGKATVSVSGDELRIGDTNRQTVYRRIKR